MSRLFTISSFRNEKDNQPRRASFDWESLARELSSPEVGAKSGGAWSPITYRDNKRAARNAEGVCALVYDLDHERADDPPSGPPTKAQMTSLMTRLGGLGVAHVLCESFTAERYRLTLPLATDLNPLEYPSTWERVRSELDIPADPACNDLARLFYEPRHPEGQTRTSYVGSGVFLDPSIFDPVDRTPLETKTEPTISANPEFSAEGFSTAAVRDVINARGGSLKSKLLDLVNGTLRLKQGERDTELNRLMHTFGKVAPTTLTVEQAVSLVQPSIAAMEGVDDSGVYAWLEKAARSFSQGQEDRVREDAQIAEARAVLSPTGPDDAWKERLHHVETKKGPVLEPHTANLELLLDHDPDVGGTVRFNVLKKTIECVGGPLEGSSVEVMDTSFSNWLKNSEWNLKMSRSDCGASLLHSSRKRDYDPVRDYLRALKWDGVVRIDTVLEKYAQATGNQDFIRLICRKFFISAVARALRPGCQVDTTLVLSGKQGGGKTSFVRALGAGFHVETKLDVASKDAVMTATNNWLVELSEMASLKKGDLESVRAFLTNKEDQIRLPYARSVSGFPRRCIFIGTTNSDQPLVDRDGNRRFWVVSVGKIDVSELEKIRDQLWAEAVAAFDSDERWWLDEAEQLLADNEASAYLSDNMYAQQFRAWYSTQKGPPTRMTTIEIATRVMGVSVNQITDEVKQAIGHAMKEIGWRKIRERDTNGRRWTYVAPNHVEDEETGEE